MQKQQEKFIDGSAKNGVNKKTAEDVKPGINEACRMVSGLCRFKISIDSFDNPLIFLKFIFLGIDVCCSVSNCLISLS